VVQEFGGKARFVSENYGDSELAKRFGVTRYPAIFVDDVLVATPRDFGFFGKGEKEGDGRYTPLKSAASHERFRADLARMIDLILSGRKETAQSESPQAVAEIHALPDVPMVSFDGRTRGRADLQGRVVLVEFWATWCPPCRSTLAWLAELKKKHGDRLEIVALAVESDEAEVRKIAADISPDLAWGMATPEIGRGFGDVTSVPTMFLFGPDGATAATFYGAPPTLHADAEARIAALLGQGTPTGTR
jgi:cytochrome c biogenesis protein CcmG/thiol:disulfide interchange protein DsbE